MDNELNPLSQQWMNPASFKFDVKIELKCPAGYSEQIQQAKKELGDVFRKTSFFKFFDTALDSDLKIRVKNRIFYAHSIILREASEVLNQKINSSLNTSDPMRVLEFDCDPELLEHILNSGAWPITRLPVICLELYKEASVYELRGLQKMFLFFIERDWIQHETTQSISTSMQCRPETKIFLQEHRNE